MALTRDDLAQDLHQLGIPEGCVLFVHSSLSALGEVEGGAETVIAALLETIGVSGTLAMPAMSGGVFEIEQSPATTGAVSEAFRRWPRVIRSFHPTHSVCALGPRTERLCADHLASETPCGPATPFGRLVEAEALVLLLGVDLDRVTLLHAAEDAVDAPYLSERRAQFRDADGEVQTKVMQRFPGPHRDFIGLGPLLRSRGVVIHGRVGRARCALLKAREAYEIAVEALRDDPGVVLCDNPECADCVKQRGAIKRRRLSEESFRLAAVLDEVVEGPPRCAPDMPDYVARALLTIAGEGIRHLELGPEWTHVVGDDAALAAEALAELGMEVCVVTTIAARGPRFDQALACAAALEDCALKLRLPEVGLTAAIEQLSQAARACEKRGLTLLVENAPNTPADSKEHCEALLAGLAGLPVRLAFNPAHFAHVGEPPFRRAFYKGPLKPGIAQLCVTDGTFAGGYTLPGRGNGEVKELISILRCRGFDGQMCLKMADRRGVAAFREHAAAFWGLLETM